MTQEIPELTSLIDSAMREPDLQEANAFITAIRVQFGPQKSGEVLKMWMEKHGRAL
jgi:hypothetical protein